MDINYVTVRDYYPEASGSDTVVAALLGGFSIVILPLLGLAWLSN